MNRVSVVNTPNYSPAVMEAAVERHFSLCELQSLIQKDMKVLVKPNLLMKRTPEEATTTHPAFVTAIIKKLQAIGVRSIVIADSPGGPFTKGALSGIYHASGMEQVSQETGVPLNFDCGSGTRAAPEGKLCRSFTLINPVLEADCIINVCKAKTHGMTMLSGGVKNLFGSIPGLLKPEMHCRFPQKEDFCTMLVDLCQTVRPTITFCDAVISMEGDGPSGGSPRRTDCTFCSTSPYLLDMALCRMMGMRETEVLTLREAKARGLCPDKLPLNALVGDPLTPVANFQMPKSKEADFSGHFPPFLRKAVHWATGSFAAPRPVVEKKKCIGCGKCAESCPVHTIQIKERKACIEPSLCIKCFCCHEMCPVRAIDIRRLPFFRV